MNPDPQRRCLILAARQALETLEPTIEQVLATLDLARVWPPSPAEVMSVFDEVDVVLAEVSRPSPAISFELGIATALRIPIVYLAAERARVSPVFSPIIRYPHDESVPKLAFLLAREVDHVLAVAGDRHQPQGGRTGVAALQVLDSARDPARDIRVGERYNGVVVHVDAAAGFVLVGSPDRPTAMLHVRNMRAETARDLAEDHIGPGDKLSVEVTEVDPRRRQVRLRDLPPLLASDETDSTRLSSTARLYRAWSAIEPVVHAAERGSGDLAAIVPSTDVDLVQRWYRLYRPEFAVIREIRNRLAHSESVSETELTTAADYAEEAHDQLEHLSEPDVQRSIERVTGSRDGAREARRSRLDGLAPRVIVLCDAPDWPPLIDRRRSRMPYGEELRLLSPHSLHGSPHADGHEYAFDRDRDQLLWFCCQGLLRNEGNVSAKVRLNGEAQFVKLRSDVPADPRKRRRLPLNNDEEPLFQERIVRPGEEVLFEWAAGHTLGEWADAYQQPDPPNPSGALFFSILITDPTGLSVRDYVFIEAAGRPIEPVPGTRSNWRTAMTQVMSTTVYPTVRQYVDEDESPPIPPWVRVYQDRDILR